MPVHASGPSRRVVLAGLGLVSPLGVGAWPTFRALLDGRCITDRRANFEAGADPVAVVQGVGHVATARRAADDPTAELAERAAREACGEAGVEPTGLPAWLGTSKGAVAAAMGPATAPPDRMGAMRAAAVALGPQGFLSHRLAVRLGAAVRGHHVAACASSLLALDAALRTLRRDPSRDHALVVTAEAALLPLFIHSYRRLGVLADATPEGYTQKPLDADRKGFVLAELAAAVVLRALPEGAEPGPGDIELVDTAVAGEAYDMVRPSPHMAAVGRVAASLLAGRPIDVLHPHAPGTADHDPTELRALADVLNAEREWTQAHRPVRVYAVKGGLGHGLGAAGLVSLVVAACCARARRRPPMPWLTRVMPGSGLPLSANRESLPEDSSHAVFAAGFGGPTAGALIRRWR